MFTENLILFANQLAKKSVHYKYYKTQYAIRALEDETLLFSHASTFNDPFDCNVNLFEFDECLKLKMLTEA